MNRIRYSFVIPVFNERETLPELHQRLSQVIDGLDGEAELLFVDDSSYDGSDELLAELGRRDPRVRVLRSRGTSATKSRSRQVSTTQPATP